MSMVQDKKKIIIIKKKKASYNFIKQVFFFFLKKKVILKKKKNNSEDNTLFGLQKTPSIAQKRWLTRFETLVLYLAKKQTVRRQSINFSVQVSTPLFTGRRRAKSIEGRIYFL